MKEQAMVSPVSTARRAGQIRWHERDVERWLKRCIPPIMLFLIMGTGVSWADTSPNEKSLLTDTVSERSEIDVFDSDSEIEILGCAFTVDGGPDKMKVKLSLEQGNLTGDYEWEIRKKGASSAEVNGTFSTSDGWEYPTSGNPPIALDPEYHELPIEGPSDFKRRIDLLPVEFVDKDKKGVSELKVGKMSETGVLTGTGASAVLDIDKDSDRFYIRVPGGAALGGISVKVSTTDNPDSAYNDNATQIDLQTEGNDAIFKSLLLVSDDVDDDHPVDGIADDATGDRTHKVQLGGNLKIEEIKIGTGAWQTLGSKTPVPAKKKVSFTVIIVKVGGTLVVTKASVEADLKVAQERFAQVGIELNWTIEEEEQPAGVDLTDEFSEYQTNTPTAEEKALIDGLGTAATDDIHVFYVSQFVPQGSAGEAFPPSYFNIPADARYTNNVIISQARKPFTLPHEIVHVVIDDAGHEPSTINLMRSGTSASNQFDGSKRMTKAQETKLHNSPFSK